MFHIKFLYYTVYVFAALCCSNATIQRKNNKNSDLDLISQFLGLHTEFCDYVQLCTIKGRINVNFSVKEQPCCRSCSCDERCIDAGNCCPDFWLRDVINDTLFDNLTDFLKFTERKTLPQKQNKSDVSLDTEEIDDNASCVSWQLRNRDSRFGFKYMDKGYIMILSCPYSYTNVEIKSGCEDPLVLTTSEIKFIPVTSFDTKRTYRNIFCLSCHEGHNKPHLPWGSRLTCSQKEVKQQLLRYPGRLFRSVAMGFGGTCNIEYTPPTDMQLRNNVCQQADVTSCPNILDNHTTSKTVTNIYEQMCRRYYLPVFVTEGITHKIYRNIACYVCNNDESLPDVCKNSYHTPYEEYQIEINVKDVTSYETKLSRLRESSLKIHYDFACNAGYMYDEVSKMCRKVLCPQHFYIYEGSCVPVLANMKGIYFEIMLKVKPRVLITTTNRFHEQYEEALDIFLTLEVRTIFSEMHTDMWRKTSNYMLHSNIVRLKFRNENDTYSETIEKLRKLLNNIRYLRNKSQTLIANIDIANNLFEQRRGQNILDSETGMEYNPGRLSKEIYSNETKFEISKTHLCYRLEMNKREILLIGKYGFKVIRTGLRTVGVDVDVSDKGRFLACIDDVIVKTVVNIGSSTVANTVVERTTDLTLFIIFGAFIAFAFCFVTGRCIFNCRHRQRTE